MKKNVIFLLFFLGPFAAFAEPPPMSGWTFDEDHVILNGKWFWSHEYASSWREQEGYALVSGKKLHFWLYDTYSYHNGDGLIILREVIPTWVEKMGYVIDYDNIEILDSDIKVASSVKTLMNMRGCYVSVSLVTKDMGFAAYDYVIVNSYDTKGKTYASVVYPIYK